MTGEDLVTREEAVARIDAGQLDQLLHPRIDPDAQVEVVATGLNASPGAASGAIVLDADLAEERGRAGEDVVLVRWETTPDDIHGLIHAKRRADGPRRDDLARCRRRARHGEALRRRLRGALDRHGSAHPQDRGRGAARGRPADDRRRFRPGDRRRGAARPTRDRRELRDRPRRGRTTSAGSASAPTPTRPPMPRRRASSAPRESASAAPSTCSWLPTGSPSCRR